MGTRIAKRIRLVLPVRAWGMDMNGKPFIQMAHTLDVNAIGGRLGGVKVKLAAGEVIGVQYRAQKARFKVMWVGEDGTPRQDQIGLKYLADERNIWPEEVPDVRGDDDYERPGKIEHFSTSNYPGATPAARAAAVTGTSSSRSLPVDTAAAYAASTPGGIADASKFKQQHARPANEKRKHTRFSCRGGVEIKRPGAESGNWAALSDVSQGGCYIETASPLAKGAQIRLLLKTDHFDVIGDATVRAVHPGVGMGVEFMHLEPSDRRFLDLLIEKLAGSESSAAAVPMMPNQEITERLQKATEEMKSIELMMTSDTIDPMVLREFRASLGHVRHTAWALQEALVLESKKDDLNPVVSFLNNERVRMATRLCKNIAIDLQLKQLKIERKDFNELLSSVEELFMRLAGVNFSMAEGVEEDAQEPGSVATEGSRVPARTIAERRLEVGVGGPEAAAAVETNMAMPKNGEREIETGLAGIAGPMATAAQQFAAHAEIELAVQDVPIFQEARKQPRRTGDRGDDAMMVDVTVGAKSAAADAATAKAAALLEAERRKKKERRKKRR